MYLNCHSYYSFLYGTLTPDELVRLGKAAGASTLALTDINNTSGWFDFLTACEKEGIQGIVGVEFRHESALQFIAIPQNNEGIYDINKFLTEYSVSKDYSEPFYSEQVFLVYPVGSKAVTELLPNEYIGVRKTELNRLYQSALLTNPEKLVALCPITFGEEFGFQVHKSVQAIDQNALLTKLDTANTARSDEYFVPENQLRTHFAQHGYLLDNTCKLLTACHLSFDLKTPKNKKNFTGCKPDDLALLTKLAMDGYAYRYGKHKEALERVKKELKIIDELNFSAYYLITWDLIRYAESRGFHHIGRGSGANSIVAYCLKISDVDPITLDLYFERFINPYRTSPPDFDIDFSWDERDEVIDYIFKRYGKEHVCLLATYNTLQGRSIIRELGKVYGLPKNEIDLLVNEPKATDRHHDLKQEIIETGKHILEFPDHLSIHAGGILITEEPLYYFTALDMMPKGFPVCQFDMHVAESWGFYKYDILSQRGLGHIKEAVDIVRENRQVVVDIHRTKDFFVDPNIKEKLRNVQTIGCFYIESPAMRGLLSKLRCDNFISLVAASSIIRPGVAKSGMMREYITRFHHPEQIEYIHPSFKTVLEETYGVMVYQEDVIKIAHHFAGLDLGESDILRRGMSGKSRSKQEFINIRDKYFANCKALGYTDELAAEVWRQIESFSGYSFCKAHSASFAVESYQSLFLKTYFPQEFMVAVINNFGGFYNTELYVHEARMSGATIEAPCVNNSTYKTCIKGSTVYMGFIHMLNFESSLGQRIVSERQRGGPYLGLYDFIQRTECRKEQLNILIRVGAFRFTGSSKQALLWEKNNYLTSKPTAVSSLTLLNPEPSPDQLPELEINPLEDVFDQMELLGFPLCSPFDLLKTPFRGEIKTVDMPAYIGKTVRMVGYYVARKDTRTTKGDIMNFGTWVDDQGRFFDTVHFPPQLRAYPFAGKGCYLLLGKIVEDFGFPSMEVKKMAKLPMVADPKY